MIDIFGNIGSGTIYGTEPTAHFSVGGVDVSFWGNIFNYDILRRADDANQAEVVYEIYSTCGIGALGRIDGRFLIIISMPGRTVIARDRHGIYSQLYYSARNYATSLHRLCKIEDGLRPDVGALAAFLVSGFIATPRSSFVGVNKLDAGHALVVDEDGGGKVEVMPLDNYGAGIDIPSSEQEMSDIYGRLHVEAVKRRIGNNPPAVGMLLSGGYDSGSNLVALRQCYGGRVDTFSIGFKGDNLTELPLARIMSRRYDTHHTEYEITGDEVMDLPKVIKALGDPFVEGGLMINYAAMQLAANGNYQVVLGGDGSDQYFGTAGRELALYSIASKCGLMPLLKLAKNILGHCNYDKSGLFKLWFRLYSVCDVMNDDLFGFMPAEVASLMPAARGANRVKDKLVNKTWESLYMQHRQVVDIERTVNQVILFKASRMADMAGCNVAFPFTDLQLLKYINRLPVCMLCRSRSVAEMARGHLTAKYLLKARYKPFLPDEVTSKKKQGGFAPMPIFFDDDRRRRRLADFVLSSSVCRDLLSRAKVEDFLRRYDVNCHDTAKWFWYRQNEAIKYFYLLSLATWWECFINNKSVTF